MPLAIAGTGYGLIGLLVLVGVLAFRYAMFFSEISFVQS